ESWQAARPTSVSQAVTRGSPRPRIARCSSEMTLVSSRYIPCPGSVFEVRNLELDVELRRVELDVLHSRHAQCFQQRAPLAAQAQVLGVAQQHVRRLAAVGDDHGTVQRCLLGAAEVL